MDIQGVCKTHDSGARQLRVSTAGCDSAWAKDYFLCLLLVHPAFRACLRQLRAVQVGSGRARWDANRYTMNTQPVRLSTRNVFA